MVDLFEVHRPKFHFSPNSPTKCPINIPMELKASNLKQFNLHNDPEKILYPKELARAVANYLEESQELDGMDKALIV